MTERMDYRCPRLRDGRPCGRDVYRCGICQVEYCVRCDNRDHGQGRCQKPS